MKEELNEFDTALVEELIELEGEQEVVRGYLRSAEELKSRVDKLVYQKVRSDYDSRLEALEKRTLPLKDEVRRQYAKLCSHHAELTTAFDKARLEKEEIEFRRSVGELVDEDLTEWLQNAEEALNQSQTELAEVEELREQFSRAFPQGEDLESKNVADPPVEESAEATIQNVGMSTTEPSEDQTISGDAPASLDVTAAVVLDSGVVPGESAERGEAPSVSQTLPPPSSEETFVLPNATLVVESGSSENEYRLTTCNYIGRSDGNHVCIKVPSVSRRHALITATSEGFQLKDLQSRSGTYVNDQRIEECLLTDGDRIKVGEARLVFRSPKP